MTPAQERIPTSEDSPIARGLRQEGVQVTGTGASRLLVAPLRGWRRALGTLVIDGPPRNVDDEQLVELSTDLARQLSIAVEGVVVLDELIRQQARLLQSEKLASLGQFIAGIAHEMNNPLQSVLGHLELMIESKEPTPHRAELKRIYHDADRAAKIVNNLLVFGGSRRATRKPVDVDALVAGVIAIREAALPKSGVQIVSNGEPSSLSVAGDAELLQQALLNVVINAEQAIGDSGRAGRVTITASAQNGRAIITVEDDGPGIAPERPAANLRSFLHDEGGRERHRARPGDRLRHRPGARRQHPGVHPNPGRRPLHHRPAAVGGQAPYGVRPRFRKCKYRRELRGRICAGASAR